MNSIDFMDNMLANKDFSYNLAYNLHDLDQ